MIGATLSTVALAATAALHPHIAARDAAALGITLTPAVVVGGNPVAVSVTLDAPTGGVVITLTTSAAAVAGFISPRLGAASSVSRLDVTVPAGARSAAVAMQTFGWWGWFRLPSHRAV